VAGSQARAGRTKTRRSRKVSARRYFEVSNRRTRAGAARNREDSTLEEERRRLQNVEKLTLLCAQSYDLIYEDTDAALTRVRLASKQVEELGGYESSFRDYREGLESARAVLEDLAFSLRDFRKSWSFRRRVLEQIEKSTGGNIQPQAEVWRPRLRVRSNTWHDRKIVCSRSSMPASVR